MASRAPRDLRLWLPRPTLPWESHDEHRPHCHAGDRVTRAERPQLAAYRPAESTATCGHEDHASPEPATMHLWLRANREDNTALACAEHLPVARRAGRLVMEHQVGPQCEMPGTAWDQANNVCVVDEVLG